MKKFLIYLVLLLQTFFAATALAGPSIPPRPTAGSGIYVQDYAGVISQADKQKILRIGQDLDNKTTAQVAVLTVKTLDGYPIEDYALEVLRQWGIGSKAKNNGVLILVSINDRQSRIEVGYGLEGTLPDGLTGRIQDQYMLPYFRKGDYSKGILQSYVATTATIAKSEGVQLTGVKYTGGAAQGQAQQNSLGLSDLLLALGLALGVIALLIIDNLFLGGFITNMLLFALLSDGGRGGGGGGFGGGSGGGGGSSRRW